MGLGSKLGQGFIDFFLKSARFEKGARRVIGVLGSMKSAMQTAANAARNVLLVGVGAATGLVRLATKQSDAEAKLAGVLRATGEAAGFTAKELIKEAAALQKVTTFGDEVIINAQAILATFKQIKGDQFKETTELAMDMATTMGNDVKGAVIQLGKALNDPAVGLTLLNRSGVTFSETQKNLIKQLVESGDLLGAQTIILKEVRSQFGGLARDLAKTDVGKFKQAINELGDAGEEFGAAIIRQLVNLMPYMERFTAWIGKLTRRDFDAFIQKAVLLGKVLIGVWVAPKLLAVMKGFITLMFAMKTAVTATAATIGVFATAGIGALTAAMLVFIAKGENAIAIMDEIRARSRDASDAFKEQRRILKELSEVTDDKKRLSLLKELADVRQKIVEQSASDLATQKDLGVDVGGAQKRLQLAQGLLVKTQTQVDDQAAKQTRLAEQQLAEQVKTRKAIEKNTNGVKVTE